jgi:lipoate-protein ligase A
MRDLEIRRWDRDDALLAAARAEGRSRCAAYRCSRVEVVLGRGGRPEVELNLDQVRRDAVPVLRRSGGGCAVVLDPGNLVVSVVQVLPGVGGITAAFQRLSDWLIGVLDHAGAPGVRQRGVSDLALGDRKVGGSCIYRTRGLLYYSATLLIAPDIGLVERYLRHPPREPAYRRGRRHRDFMGTLPADAAPLTFLSSLRRELRASEPPHGAGA